MHKNRPLPNDGVTLEINGASRTDSVLPAYETPMVFSYTDEDIMDQLGPARVYGSITIASDGTIG